jgi:hypothetical protein
MIMPGDELYQEVDLELIKIYHKVVINMVEKSTPRQLFKALLYGDLTDKEVALILSFTVDMVSTAVTLQLLPMDMLSRALKEKVI